MESLTEKRPRRLPTAPDMLALGVLQDLRFDDPWEAASVLQSFMDSVTASKFLMASDISVAGIEDLIAELNVLAMSLDDENAAHAWEKAKVTFRSSRHE